MLRASLATLLCLLICGGHVAADGEERAAWYKRVENVVEEAEAAAAKLDGKTVSASHLAKRLKALHARVCALESAAGRKRGYLNILDSGGGAELLSNWSNAAISLKSRLRRLTEPERKVEKRKPEATKKKPARKRPVRIPHAIGTDYDRFEDVTSIMAYLHQREGRLQMTIGFLYAGDSEKPREDMPGSHVLVNFWFSPKDWKEYNDDSVVFITSPGQKRIEAVAVRERWAEIEHGSMHFRFRTDVSSLRALGAAERAVARLGKFKFALTKDHITTLRFLAEMIEPAGDPADAPDDPNAPIKASGSGFVVGADGYIVTSEHVVAQAARVVVSVGGKRLPAKVVKRDAANDVAILKVEAKLKPAPIAPSRRVRLGATVATLGFPNIKLQGQAHKLAKGEIASLTGAVDDPRYFQISVPVQPGNSGGPLFDMRGNVVGVIAAKLNDRMARAISGESPENVNYAIKSAYLLALLESIPALSQSLRDPVTEDRSFEDVVAAMQESVVLIYVY